ncbi:hypothetical protein [Actinoallomurus sp. CA-142502]|uniref:hypothetical protein n=1 Tax=Actinoallomurus sp. CA-142502 TaxID=3239885 RepID=UPI003D8A1C4E
MDAHRPRRTPHHLSAGSVAGGYNAEEASTTPELRKPHDDATTRPNGDEAGGQFDHDFIGKTQTEIAKGTEPQISTLAQSTLPVLREHLATLRKAAPTG